MRIAGTLFAILLILVGVVLLIDAFTHSIGINFLASGPSNTETEGNGVLGIAVAALPAVVGLVILSKLYNKQDPSDPGN